MTKAIITQTSPTTVRRVLPTHHILHQDRYNPEATPQIDEYWIPNRGGYVRLGDVQVCRRLNPRGSTLTATPDTLLAVIRKEHNASLSMARKIYLDIAS